MPDDDKLDRLAELIARGDTAAMEEIASLLGQGRCPKCNRPEDGERPKMPPDFHADARREMRVTLVHFKA